MNLRHAFAWKTLQFVVIFVIELGGLAVLARLLTPLEMGVFAAAMALLRFGQFVGSFGLHNVILRQHVLDFEFRRQIMGLCAAAVFIVTGAYVILLLVLGLEGPQGILAMLLPVIPLMAFSMPANALLVREMRFQTQFYLRLISSVLFPICAIPLALSGMGPASLAIATVVSATAYAGLSVWATGRSFAVVPSLRVEFSMLQFASTIFLLNAIHEGREAATTLLIGRFAGLGALGQFSRAAELELKANQVVSETVLPVLTPHLFNKARQSREKLRFEVLRALEYITALSWPLAVGLIFLGAPLVRIVLGDQWDLAGDILQIMGFGLAIRSITGILSTASVAMKKERSMLKIAAFNLVVSLTIVVALASISVIGMLAALIAFQWAVMGLYFRVVAVNLSISLRDIGQISWRSIGVSAFVGVGLLVLDAVIPEASAGLHLFSGFVVGLACWCAGLFMTKHPLLGEILALLAKFQHPKKRSQADA